jgi:dipeptidyl aminopeptidase/acylaminoacyl peptidase
MRSAVAGLALVLIASIATADSAPSDNVGAAPGVHSVPRVSAEDFGALPFIQNPKLSPSGMKALARAQIGGQSKLVVLALGAKTAPTHVFAIPDQNDLVWYRWAGEDRVLISLGRSAIFDGEEVYATRLAVIDLNANKLDFVGKRTEGIDGDDVIHVDRDGKWLLLSIQQTIYDYPSVWRVDLDTLKMSRVVNQRQHVWDWYADSSGTVRAGVGANDQRWWLLYRKDGNSDFETVRREKRNDNAGDIARFIPIDGSDKGYAIANTKTGRYGLYHYDFATDSLGETIFEHQQVDIDDFRLSEKGEIEGVFYTDDRSRVAWLDPEMKRLQEEVDGALPDRINRVVSFNRDATRMIVWTGSASDPGRYYYYHRASARMQLLAQPYAKVNGKDMSAVESTTYHARDGLEIPAYLTLPADRATKALPLIVMPHGGPFVRDEWSYDVWAQFLANRGYLVLQPNYRGSTGYGKAFVDKGLGQWGRAMQDDIDDGVKWLVDQGKVDPKRVCIMGASYGGYAAMWAAARNPDIYRCAISLAGISDVEAMLKYDRKLFSATRYYRNWREKVQGDKEFDLATVSPLRAVDRISIPLLIAHGDKDETVPVAQSRKLHDALTKANRPHEFVVYEGEGHGFDQPEHSIDFLKRVEAFLKTHNPADEKT